MNYQPIGNKVLLKVLPPKERGSIIIPDHLKKSGVTGEQQFFRVEALGPSAVDENHALVVGQQVMVSSHPSLLVGVSIEEALVVCNNKDIACICTEAQTGLN